MATSTTNLSLIKPAGTDKVRIAQINQNMDILDEKIGPVGNTSVQNQIIANDSGMAIVSTGNTHNAIASGQYVYIRSHGTLAEGLYKANSAISANATLSTSNVTHISSGGMNDLKGQIDSLNSNMAKGAYTSWGTSLTANNFHIGLVLIGNVAAYEVWFASTADINIRSLRASDSAKAGTNTVSFGPDIITDSNYTITRNGTTLTLTATTNSTLAILYV